MIARETLRGFLKFLSTYLRLGAWLDQRVSEASGLRRTIPFASVEAFWRSVTEDELKPESIIRFQGAFLTEWVPMRPGQVWLKYLRASQAPPHSNGIPGVMTSKDILSRMREGRGGSSESVPSEDYSEGVVRLPLGVDNDAYAVLSVTTADSWLCDLAIPVLVSKQVYARYLERRDSHNAVECDLEADLRFGTLPLINARLLRSLGSPASDDLVEYLLTPIAVPSLYLYISSPLSIKVRRHNSHPAGNLAVLVKNHSHEEKVTGSNTPERPTIFHAYISNGTVDFRLLSKTVQLNEPDDIRSATDLFKSGTAFPLSHFPLERYDHSVVVDSTEVLTEFDSRVRHFVSSFPIGGDLSSAKAVKNLTATLGELKETNQK